MKTSRKKKRGITIPIRTVSVGQVINQIVTDDKQLIALIEEQVERNTERAKQRY